MNSQIDELLAQLSLEEKASLCSGQNFWQSQALPAHGIPAIFITDGPHGLRKQLEHLERVDIRGVPATCFPTAAALANSWNRDLLYAIGCALGDECLQEGVAILLGPGANIKRSPLCGRNFEYFSEDPYLSGELAAQWIHGVQNRGVGTSLKHFAVNNQEYRRMIIDAVVDARALREIYLAGFEIAVKQAQPWTVMAAYNRVNGSYCAENVWLLDEVLRKEWGFRGIVLSDWGGTNDRVAGLRAGLDLEMPSSAGINDKRIVEAVRNKQLDLKVLDKTVRRLLALILLAENNKKSQFHYDRNAHHALARRAATQSAVLLKNDDCILPIAKDRKVAIIGAFAQVPRYQGTGSSQINPWRVDCALDELQHYGVQFEYAPGYRREDDEADAELIAAACSCAARAEVAVIFAGLPEIYESEGFDRKHLRMPASHNQLIEAVVAQNSNTIVILSSGAPVEMPWLSSVKGVIAAYLGGQAGGAAIVDILLGVACPSGKLAETWPLQLHDTPAYHSFPGGPHAVEYRESLYVGYRYYDSVPKAAAFPFGHGLSYTNFVYSNLTLSKSELSSDEILTVVITIRNDGARAAAEVVQLYVHDCESTVFRPAKELKGFARVLLQPGESQQLSFDLDRRAYAFFDIARNDWCVESGQFTILIGASSSDIRARAEVFVHGDNRNDPSLQLRYLAPDYFRLKAGEFNIDDKQFTALYGRPLNGAQGERPYHLNSLLCEVKSTWLGKLLYKGVLTNAQQMAVRAKDPVLEKMISGMVAEMPLRQLVAFSGGRLNFEMMDILLAIMNGGCLSGLRLLASRFAKRRRSSNSK